MGLGSIEDGSNATMVLPNAHMGPSGAEALVIPATRSDQCPLTPLHWDHFPTKKKKIGEDVLIPPQSAGLCWSNVQPIPLRFPMFSNVFQCYLLSFSLSLSLTISLSHSHTLSISH